MYPYLHIWAALIGCLCATHVTLVRSIYVMVALLWLVLFCGGAVLPACSGTCLVVDRCVVWCDALNFLHIYSFINLFIYLLTHSFIHSSIRFPSSFLTLPIYTSTFSPCRNSSFYRARRHRPVSSSLSLVVFNLFGYFLSLVLSGYLMQVRTYVRYVYMVINEWQSVQFIRWLIHHDQIHTIC